MFSQWPFDEPRNLAVLSTTNVLQRNFPILTVVHDQDGEWQFICGQTNETEDIRVVALESMYRRDSSIGELADLPLGWQAWRNSPNSLWQREAYSE